MTDTPRTEAEGRYRALWMHLLGWLDMSDDATIAEVEAKVLTFKRYEEQAPCRHSEDDLTLYAALGAALREAPR